MFIKTYTTLSKFNRRRRHIVLQCDTCQKEFETFRRQYLKKTSHWCSVKCTNEAMKSGGIINTKIKDEWLKVYGVSHPMLNPGVQEKHKKTCLDHYGVSSPLVMSHVRARLNDQDVIDKKFTSYVRNGSYNKSKPEDLCYELLVQTHGAENVERQIHVNGWSIDFYVIDVDTYVQFDGAYWHGLDRPVEEISQYKTKRDVIIHKKWLRDRAQDVWFAERGMRLIRITDKDIYRAINNADSSNVLIELGIVDASG